MNGPGTHRREGDTTRGRSESDTDPAVSTDPVLTPLDLRVLAIVREVDRRGQYRTTYRLLAAGAGCARSTVHTSLARLQAAGLVEVHLGGTGLVILPLGGGGR